MRIGTLGAARITRESLIQPARDVSNVEVVAVAARERDRAEAFAQLHGIPRVHDTYEGLLADDSIDAIYNPLPNSAHAEWSIRALQAGKHVLCEKPLASNAAEAAEMVTVASRSGRILMEAFHWVYHPAAARLEEIVRRLGPLRRAEAVFLANIADEGDIRYQLALGGGSLMDLGCYCVHALRTISGEEPTVLSARATERPPGVDQSMQAELAFPSGWEGRIRSSFAGPAEPVWFLVFEGVGGRARLENFVKPHLGHRITAELSTGESIDEELSLRSSYAFQLEALRDAAAGELTLRTGGHDAIANMAAIDAIYLAAGLPTR